MKISFIKPTFNQAGFLPETLASIQAKNIDAFEHVLIDAIFFITTMKPRRQGAMHV